MSNVMKCIYCDSGNITTESVKGFSKEPLHECKDCGKVWLEQDKQNGYFSFPANLEFSLS